VTDDAAATEGDDEKLPKPPIVIPNPPVADDGVVVRNTDGLADQAAQN